jgi:SAM-dependent methyltransferase/tetratricopeptide (TPR) repeat protein
VGNDEASDVLTAEKHEAGVHLYRLGQFEKASQLLGEALGEAESSELANDWAAAELACGHPARAEQGFVRALRMDPANVEAAENLGALLGGLGRTGEAVAMLEQAARQAQAPQRSRLLTLLAEYRNRATDRRSGEPEGAQRSTATISARLPSRPERRSTEGYLVYKPDFAHVRYREAAFFGTKWEAREDHAVGGGEGAALRWQATGKRGYALLTHFPWGGKVAVFVNRELRDIADLYSHGKYVEPLELFHAETARAVEVELRVVGRNPLAKADQLALYGFLVEREELAEPPRVETEDGFVAVQKQQVVNWLESIKRRGLTLEEVTEQRKGAYTLRVGEALAFMKRGGRVLDLGCGYVFKEILRDVVLTRGIEYWLQDIDPEVCAANRQLFGELGLAADHVYCNDNTNLPYPDGLFDGVFSSHCLEHSKDVERTFCELGRIINRGGTLVYAVLRNWDRAEEHMYAPLNGGWEAFTEQHGFRVISSNLGCYYGEGGENDLMVMATRA